LQIGFGVNGLRVTLLKQCLNIIRVEYPPKCGDAMDHENEEPHAHEKPEKPPRIVDAGELFGEHREVWIDLEGVRYRLRITRRNKLILQK
jgi:hemin uptake protein HemP